jgi:small subunit ribosomal protein S9
MTSSKKTIATVGRRKSAIARVRLVRGKEEIVVNDKQASVYFPGEVWQKLLKNPLKLTDLIDKYTATVKVVGSGKYSQLLAVIHGLARALVELDAAKYKPLMRSAGLLTRDPRMRQRRNVGTGGKARRKKQSPKR